MIEVIGKTGGYIISKNLRGRTTTLATFTEGPLQRQGLMIAVDYFRKAGMQDKVRFHVSDMQREQLRQIDPAIMEDVEHV